jgi:DNA polymerase-1
VIDLDLSDIEEYAAEVERDEVSDSVQELVPGRVLHLDGDYAAYFCAGGDGMQPHIAREVTEARIDRATRMAGATAAVVHLTHGASDKGGRFDIATVKPYQGQRAGHKPKNWRTVREYLELAPYKLWKRAIWRDREADDGMGLASNCYNPMRNIVIHTRDKDMRMLPGTHMTWMDWIIVHVPEGAYEVIGADGETYGHKWFWLQMLQGDSADHIPGLEKYEGKDCGKVTAAELLAGTRCNADAFDVVRGAYRSTYMETWGDRFAEQAGLLWIRRTATAPLHEFLVVCPQDNDLLRGVQQLQDRVRNAKDARPKGDKE